MDVVKRVSMAALESSGMNLPLEALDPYIRDNFAQTQQTNATDYRAPPDASLSTWSEILRFPNLQWRKLDGVQAGCLCKSPWGGATTLAMQTMLHLKRRGLLRHLTFYFDATQSSPCPSNEESIRLRFYLFAIPVALRRGSVPPYTPKSFPSIRLRHNVSTAYPTGSLREPRIDA
eukprot:1156879-Pelagomonas_calceolata.AAC.4